MAEAKIRADKALRPAYYDDFHCLAEGCKITCCKGWSITFNKKDYLSLKRQTGSPELNALLKDCVRRVRKGEKAEKFYGEFNMDSGVCPLFGKDSLCCLQKEKGHAALPYVCRTYPRAETYMTSGYLERSLSPSCEGVLSLLWDLPEGIEFRSDPLPKERCKIISPVEDGPLPLCFSVVREWCVDVLQNRRLPLAQRIFLMGMGLKELADGEEDIDRWKGRAEALADSTDLSGVLPAGERELDMYLTNCAQTFLAIKSQKTNRATVSLWKGSTLLYSGLADTVRAIATLPVYRAARARYEERFAGREYFMENLMVSVFFHLHMPHMNSREDLWKGYVNFCNLYAFYRFVSVMSCREGAAGDRDKLFGQIVYASRSLIHNDQRQSRLRDELFQNDSATLAHMAILLCG